MKIELRKTADNLNPPPVIMNPGAIFATIDKPPFKVILLLSGQMYFVNDLPELPNAASFQIEAGETFRALGSPLTLSIRRDAIAAAYPSGIMQSKISTITGNIFTAVESWERVEHEINNFEAPDQTQEEEPGEDSTEDSTEETEAKPKPEPKKAKGGKKEGKK
jgi:hypothetical protein